MSQKILSYETSGAISHDFRIIVEALSKGWTVAHLSSAHSGGYGAKVIVVLNPPPERVFTRDEVFGAINGFIQQHRSNGMLETSEADIREFVTSLS